MLKLYSKMNLRSYFLVCLTFVGFGCREENKQSADNVKTGSLLVQKVKVSGPWHSHENTTTPNLFSDDSKLYLSWIKKDSLISTLYFSRLDQNIWSVPELIAQGENWFVNWADFPQFSAHKDTLMVTFLKKSDSGTYNYDILYSLKRANKSWEVPQRLHRDSAKAEHGFVSIAPNHKGFLVSWLDGRNTRVSSNDQNYGGTSQNHQSHGANAMSLRGTLVGFDASLNSESLIDERVCDCCQTAIALDHLGRAVVAYRDRSKEEIRDISLKRGSPEFGWSDPVSTGDQWRIAGCPVNGPSIDIFQNHLALAWFTAGQDNPRVQVVFSGIDSLKLTPAIRMDSGAAIGRVDIVQLSEESAVVSWVEPQGEEDFVRAQWVNNLGRKGPLLTISQTSSSRASGFPRLVRHGDLFYMATTYSVPGGPSKIALTSWPLSAMLPTD